MREERCFNPHPYLSEIARKNLFHFEMEMRREGELRTVPQHDKAKSTKYRF
jgi:hypothetical protein